MKKLLCVWISFGIISCTAAGVGGKPNPNSVISMATDITGNYSNSAIGNIVVGVVNGITFINESSQLWNMAFTDYFDKNYQGWMMLPSLQVDEISQIANNSFGILFAGSTSGGIYKYYDGSWQSYAASSENSAISSVVIANGNAVFAGNESGNIWYYNNSWNKLTSTAFNGRIQQLAIDSVSVPRYIGVVVGSNLYACRFTNNACGNWRNLITEVGSAYTDVGSKINAIAFRQTNEASYGYLGNSKGHIWRGIYQGSSVTSFLNITDSSIYPGYNDKSPVTSLLVTSDNSVLFAGTQSGQVFIWTKASLAWSNITPANSIAAITALANIDDSNIVVTNQQGTIWSVKWK